MKRFWLLPLAALSLAGAVSVAQAAPASPMLGTLKVSTAGKAQQVNWRWYNYRRYHHHRRHHHHRRGW